MLWTNKQSIHYFTVTLSKDGLDRIDGEIVIVYLFHFGSCSIYNVGNNYMYIVYISHATVSIRSSSVH